MATANRVEAACHTPASRKSALISNPDVRCPCCGVKVAHLPPPWTIEPCQLCWRPLTLVRMFRRPTHYRLRNVIDLASSIYGIVTMLLVLSFVASKMGPRTFAKAVTILMFVIGSLLLVDGTLSLRTSIDQTWRVTRHGRLARLIGAGKVLGGLFAIMLVFVGIHL